MSNCSPKDIADDVYWALESGSELPPLPNTLDTKIALLTFSLESPDQDQGHDPEQERQSHCNDNQEPGHSKHQQSWFRPKLCMEEGQGQSVYALETESAQPSLLILEALSRRRLDAIRQLHEMCPQLLSSIPMFDPRHETQLREENSCQFLFAERNDDEQNCWLVDVPSSQVPPIRRTSRLLDRAAENRELLVFVLRNHPGMHRAERRPELPSSRHHGADKVSEDIYSREHVQNAKVPDPSLEVKDKEGITDHPRRGSTGEDMEETRKETEEKTQLGLEWLASLDPASPLTICLQKNNTNVLQYLLHKHVWQHFLLDDVFTLPQTSQVPDLDPNRPRTPRPEIDWFLHCCALIGCPPLLDRVLSGAFKADTVAPTSDQTHQRDHCERPEVRKSEPSSEALADGVVEEYIELYEDSVSDLAPGSEGHSDVDSHSLTATVHLSKTAFPPDTIQDDFMNRKDNEMPALLYPETVLFSEQENETFAPQNVETETLPARFTSKTAQVGKICRRTDNPNITPRADKTPSRKPYCPEPGTRVPVSLPLMDRWISRCMHLSCAPLHLACWRCDAGSIRVLLKHDADVNALAEELESPEDKDGDKNSAGGSHSHNSSTASSEVSYIELAVSTTAPFTLTSSSFDLLGPMTTAESALRVECRERRGVTPLALLALGLRSPPDFSLSIGRTLGLVLPTLPESTPGGQIDRSCPEARMRAMEALRLLLDAGADVNAYSTIFRKGFRPLELFLQPPVDLYYAPLMPRGGRDSAVLRCLDLERVAELVLSACWELVACGARLGPGFAASLEWTLFRMDWMFLQNESVQRRFTHLAIFLGLFPSMAPSLPVCSCFPEHPNLPHFDTAGLPPDYDPGTLRQCSARPSPATLRLGWSYGRTVHPDDNPPRPSCIPWSRSTEDGYASDSSPSVPASRTDVTLPSTSAVVTAYDNAIVASQRPHANLRAPVLETSSQTDPEAPEEASSVDEIAADWVQVDSHSSEAAANLVESDMHSPAAGTTLSEAATRLREVATHTREPATHSREPETHTRESTAQSRKPAMHSGESATHSRKLAYVNEPAAAPNHRPGCAHRGITPYAVQMAAWASEEKQRKVLERFVSDVVRLSVPQRTLSLILRFLTFSDLLVVAELTERASTMQAHERQEDSTWDRIRESVRLAQARTLRHSCKVVILAAAKWRYCALQSLPLPESLKRYLHDPQC